MVRAFFLIGCLLAAGVCQAETGGAFARRLQQSGSLYHDNGYNGRENVFWTSGGAFPRLQARVAWRHSPGHKANLPMMGLRVSRGTNGTYVVGRR